MLINLDELNVKNEINFEYDVSKDDKLDNRIKDLRNAHATGRVYINEIDEIVLECNFSGTMFIEDSISLDVIPYDFNIDIEENINDLEENYNEVYQLAKNTLDLKEVLWQNIVLEVPISYTKVSDAELKGEGWELLMSDNKKEKTDPRLKKLEELLERRD